MEPELGRADVLIHELTGGQDSYSLPALEGKEVVIPRDNDIRPAGQRAGENLVVVRIPGHRFRQSRRVDQLGCRGNEGEQTVPLAGSRCAFEVAAGCSASAFGPTLAAEAGSCYA